MNARGEEHKQLLRPAERRKARTMIFLVLVMTILVLAVWLMFENAFDPVDNTQPGSQAAVETT